MTHHKITIDQLRNKNPGKRGFRDSFTLEMEVTFEGYPSRINPKHVLCLHDQALEREGATGRATQVFFISHLTMICAESYHAEMSRQEAARAKKAITMSMGDTFEIEGHPARYRLPELRGHHVVPEVVALRAGHREGTNDRCGSRVILTASDNAIPVAYF